METRDKLRVTLLLGLCCATGLAAVPNPTVTGPIPARATPGDPSHDYPFFSTNVNLSTYGFVEAEFFLEGTANRYNTPALATGTVIDGGHPYRTRMVVRRPTSEFTFNGTVILEWMNSAANYDLDGAWLASHDHFLRRGYAWVGISAQQAGIHAPATGLKVWSPARYASLDVTQGGAILDDALSSVDTHTEDQILNQLREIMRGRTTVFISHRVSTVRSADRIAVLHGGRIVEYGTHDELLAGDGYYTDLYNKQLLEEELAGEAV